jgi:small subunit ribosomal protein S17
MRQLDKPAEDPAGEARDRSPADTCCVKRKARRYDRGDDDGGAQSPQEPGWAKWVSDRMDKTAVVSIERLVKHPTYGRYVRRRNKFKVHDEKNECRVGDIIRFMETRPLSKDKRWRFVEFVERAK